MHAVKMQVFNSEKNVYFCAKIMCFIPMVLLKKWSENYIEAGCDEVGRGCLCGPVVAAAVILDDEFQQNLIQDSKQLNGATRAEMSAYIKENAKDFAVRSEERRVGKECRCKG